MKRFAVLSLCVMLLPFMPALSESEAPLSPQWNEQTVAQGDTYFDAGDKPIRDLEAFKAFLAQCPSLQKVDLFATTLTSGSVFDLTDCFPDIEFGLTMRVAEHIIRTDATVFSTLHSSRSKEHTSKEFSVLKFCKNLVALDLGHNRIDDLSMIADMTQLRILILAVNRVSDLTALEKLESLEYLELFMNRIEDISPLAKLVNLRDLELTRNKISDYTPLMGLKKLERLKLFRSGRDIPKQALTDALPLCDIDFSTNPTQGTWRKHPRYYDIADILQNGVYHEWTVTLP